MKSVITSQELEPLPIKKEELVNKPLGFLNSNYKQLVTRNYNAINTRSVFGIRQRLKSKQFNTCCSIETALKVSLFLAVFLVAIV